MLGVTTDDTACYFQPGNTDEIRQYPLHDDTIDIEDYEEVPTTSLEGYLNAHRWNHVNQFLVDELDETRLNRDIDELLDGDTP